MRIRDGKLYRKDHPTFEAYCSHRWGFDRHYAHRLIDGVKVARMLPIGNTPAPATESQARELAPLLDDGAKVRLAVSPIGDIR